MEKKIKNKEKKKRGDDAQQVSSPHDDQQKHKRVHHFIVKRQGEYNTAIIFVRTPTRHDHAIVVLCILVAKHHTDTSMKGSVVHDVYFELIIF